MTNHLKQTQEFHNTFNVPVLQLGEVPAVERRKLRLNLIFEELSELAYAFGLDVTFHEMCYNHCKNLLATQGDEIQFLRFRETELFNKVEALDACADLQVVLDGTILECGFGEIMEESSTEVFESNMSKACNSMEEAADTGGKYYKEGVRSYPEENNGKFIVYRIPDNKILKSVNYKPANLAQFIK